MKVRIQNDGQPGYMTRVTDVETGESLENITGIDLSIRPEHELRAMLTVSSPIIDVIADAEIKGVCPYCGKPVAKE